MIAEPVRKLATVVSLAARIEPELLRAARLRLLPEVDVSAEADLWFSTLVASRSTRRVVLDAEICMSMRESLASDPALLNAARAVVVEIHRNAPPAIQLEEEILYLALTGADVADAINTKLTSVLNAIANEGRRGLIDWAARALPSMPDVVQNTTAAAALRLVAGGERAAALHVRRAVIDDPAIAALIEKALPRTKVFARLVPREHTLCVEISRTELPAAHEIELPKTEPLVLELTTANQSEIVDVPPEGALVRTIVESVSIRTIAREVFRIKEVQEEERTTVRLLVMTGLGKGDLVLPDEPNIDVVLIPGNIAKFQADHEAYFRIADRLREHFGETPIIAVPGTDDDPSAFLKFKGRIGFTSDQNDFAKTLLVRQHRLGIVGIDSGPIGRKFPQGGFEGSQINNVCNGDPSGWSRAHDVAILLIHDAPEHLDSDSQRRWDAFGTEDIFDFIVFGSANTPELTSSERGGYVVVELPDPDGRALVSIHRGSEVEIRRQAIHARSTYAPLVTDHHRRVLVAGISEGLSIPLQELCRAIGSLLALQGHDLLTGGWPGVDYLAAEGFDKAAPNQVASISHYVGGERKISDYPRGRQIVSDRDEEALSRAVREADVVILIEGESGTRAVGREALHQGKPVIPIGAGAAEELRADVLRTWPAEMHERLQRLGDRANAVTVGEVNELLREVGAKVPGQETSPPERILFSYSNARLVEEFKSSLASVTLEQIATTEIAIVFIDAPYLAASLGELNVLIGRARRGELTLYWFLAGRCEDASYASTGIAEFQAANDRSKPLDEMPPPLRRALFRSFAVRYLTTLKIPEGINEESFRTIAAIRSTVEDLTERDFPLEWAKQMSDLGDAFLNLREQPDSADLASAIGAYAGALRIYTSENAPLDHARVTFNLANAYSPLPEYFEPAVRSYESALLIYSEQGREIESAMVYTHLADLYQRSPENVHLAIGRYEQALEILRKNALFEDEARVTYRLATALETTDVESAVARYQSAAALFADLGMDEEAAQAKGKLRALSGRQSGAAHPTVMVSSTYPDLAAHREALIDAIQRLGFFAAGLEYNASKPAQNVIASSYEMVDRAQVYVGILSHRYGAVPEDPQRNPQRLSITELEYRRAVEAGIPVLMFVMSDRHAVRSADVERSPEYLRKLEALKRKVRERSIVAEFSSVDELRTQAIRSLTELRERGARAATPPRNPRPLTAVVGAINAELVELRSAVLAAINRLNILAIGGHDSPNAGKELITWVYDMIDRAQIYIGILTHRYTLVPNDPERNPQRLSIAELEYRRALERGVPVLMFLMSDHYETKFGDVEPNPDYRKKLQALKAEVRERAILHEFESIDQLRDKLTQSLTEFRFNEFKEQR